MTTIAESRRVKKSYSISAEAESFVRKVRKARKIRSDSEALDQLLRESIEAHRRSKIDAAYKAYYDAASEAELAEEAIWAEFAESELAAISK
jgi:hypothetical protein